MTKTEDRQFGEELPVERRGLRRTLARHEVVTMLGVAGLLMLYFIASALLGR